MPASRRVHIRPEVLQATSVVWALAVGSGAGSAPQFPRRPCHSVGRSRRPDRRRVSEPPAAPQGDIGPAAVGCVLAELSGCARYPAAKEHSIDRYLVYVLLLKKGLEGCILIANGRCLLDNEGNRFQTPATR